MSVSPGERPLTPASVNGRLKPPTPGPGMEGALHDLTNALAAARSFGELLLIRSQSGSKEDPVPLITSLLGELERVGEIARQVRSGNIETFHPGDVLCCNDCGYTFVHRKVGKLGSCRRCKSYQVGRWKPA